MGFTRDMSKSGIYVVCDNKSLVPAGASIEVEVLLPLSGQAERLRLRTEGSVLRSGESGEDMGFAVAAEFGC